MAVESIRENAGSERQSAAAQDPHSLAGRRPAGYLIDRRFYEANRLGAQAAQRQVQLAAPRGHPRRHVKLDRAGKTNRERGGDSDQQRRKMRVHDAAADQMRALKIAPDFISTAEGSVLIELGKTGDLHGDGGTTACRDSPRQRQGLVTSEYDARRATENHAREATEGNNPPNAGDSTIDRLPARGTDKALASARLARLRCDSGIPADADSSITGAFVALALRSNAAGRGNAETFATDDTVAATSVGIVDDRGAARLGDEEDARGGSGHELWNDGTDILWRFRRRRRAAFSGSECKTCWRWPAAAFDG